MMSEDNFFDEDGNNINARMVERMNGNFVLWFHEVNNDDYTINSYQKIMELKTYKDLLECLKGISNINSGMFFLMREGITPIWENEENKNGGFWTFKVSKQDSYNMWCELLLNFCFHNISNNDVLINGISVSPKINNCIFKIWNKNKENNDINCLRNDLKYLNLKEGLYRPHVK